MNITPEIREKVERVVRKRLNNKVKKVAIEPVFLDFDDEVLQVTVTFSKDIEDRDFKGMFAMSRHIGYEIEDELPGVFPLVLGA